MIITLATDRTPRLDDPDNFRAFKVTAPKDMDAAALRGALGSLGRLADNDHAWIDEAALRTLANRPNDKTWQDNATAMLAYARKSGWIDAETGAIRAHIERV